MSLRLEAISKLENTVYFPLLATYFITTKSNEVNVRGLEIGYINLQHGN